MGPAAWQWPRLTCLAETVAILESKASEIGGRIDRSGTFPKLEVKLRRRHVAALAGLGDHLAAPNRIAPLHVQLAIVRIRADEPVRVPN